METETVMSVECSKCAMPISAGLRYCEACGAPVATVQKIAPPIKKQKNVVNAILAASLLALLVGSGIIYWLVRSVEKKEVGQTTKQKAESPNSSSGPPSSTSTNGTTSNSAPIGSFSKSFEGTINDKINIEMEVNINGNNISGSYFYKKYRTKITLNGTIDQQLNFIISEYDASGNKTGEFRGTLNSTSGKPDYTHPSNNDKMEGNWSNSSGNKTMRFLVLEKT